MYAVRSSIKLVFFSFVSHSRPYLASIRYGYLVANSEQRTHSSNDSGNRERFSSSSIAFSVFVIFSSFFDLRTRDSLLLVSFLDWEMKEANGTMVVFFSFSGRVNCDLLDPIGGFVE